MKRTLITETTCTTTTSHGKTLSAERITLELDGTPIKVIFNAVVTGADGSTMRLRHAATLNTTVSIPQAVAYYDQMIATFKKSGRLSIH